MSGWRGSSAARAKGRACRHAEQRRRRQSAVSLDRRGCVHGTYVFLLADQGIRGWGVGGWRAVCWRATRARGQERQTRARHGHGDCSRRRGRQHRARRSGFSCRRVQWAWSRLQPHRGAAWHHARRCSQGQRCRRRTRQKLTCPPAVPECVCAIRTALLHTSPHLPLRIARLAFAQALASAHRPSPKPVAAAAAVSLAARQHARGAFTLPPSPPPQRAPPPVPAAASPWSSRVPAALRAAEAPVAMFRDPVLRPEVDDGEERSRPDRRPPGHQGEPTPSAYHTSPTQAGLPYQHRSPNTPTPTPTLHPHQHHHRPPASPASTELPPISTALYPRDTSRYYDPTSDNGDRGIARDPARFDSQYPAQVRTCLFFFFLLLFRLRLLVHLPSRPCAALRDALLTSSTRSPGPGPSRLPRRPPPGPEPLRKGPPLARRHDLRAPPFAPAAPPFAAPAHARHGDDIPFSRLAVRLSVNEPPRRRCPAALGLRQAVFFQG